MSASRLPVIPTTYVAVVRILPAIVPIQKPLFTLCFTWAVALKIEATKPLLCEILEMFIVPILQTASGGDYTSGDTEQLNGHRHHFHQH